jgi:hypothetical protein
MKRLILFFILALPWSVFAAQGSAANAAADVRDPAAVADVLAGRRSDASAAWWGFDPEDSTAALQAAIDSHAKRVLVPYMGAPWIVRSITLRSDQEIDFEPGVLVLAKRHEFRGGGGSLFSANGVDNLTLRGYGATLRMWKKDYQNPPYQKAEWRLGALCPLQVVKSVDLAAPGIRRPARAHPDSIASPEQHDTVWRDNLRRLLRLRQRLSPGLAGRGRCVGVRSAEYPRSDHRAEWHGRSHAFGSCPSERRCAGCARQCAR